MKGLPETIARHWRPVGLLMLVVFILQVRTVGFGFVNFDDNSYVYENLHVMGGLTWGNILWAFTIHGPSMWIPLTWLSHQAMVTVFGVDPGPQHALNVLLHAVNAALLFLLVRRLGEAAGGRERGPSEDFGRLSRIAFFVALMFAVHPVHVESVAWITERKDVLSLFFSLLALLAYLSYGHSGKRRHYAACLSLWMDAWPLMRRSARNWKRPLLEKLPLLAVSALASWLTLLCQWSIGAVGSLAAYPLGARILNALDAYGIHLRRLFWPVDLAVFYPYPDTPDIAGAAAGLAAIALLAVVAWRLRKPVPQLGFGLLWFLGTLVPMIGLVQAGAAHLADRYAYLPYIGLNVGLAWTGHHYLASRPRLLYVVALSFMAFLVVLNWRQTSTWRDSEALFTHAVRIAPGNWLAENNLGLALQQKGRTDEARIHFLRSLEARPDYAEALNNLAILDAEQGVLDKAYTRLLQALQLQPQRPTTWHNLGKVQLARGFPAEAEGSFDRAIELSPDFLMARYDRGCLLLEQLRNHEAADAFSECVRLNPRFVHAWINLGVARSRLGDVPGALQAYDNALAADPANTLASRNRELLREK